MLDFFIRWFSILILFDHLYLFLLQKSNRKLGGDYCHVLIIIVGLHGIPERPVTSTLHCSVNTVLLAWIKCYSQMIRAGPQLIWTQTVFMRSFVLLVILGESGEILKSFTLAELLMYLLTKWACLHNLK